MVWSRGQRRGGSKDSATKGHRRTSNGEKNKCALLHTAVLEAVKTLCSKPSRVSPLSNSLRAPHYPSFYLPFLSSASSLFPTHTRACPPQAASPSFPLPLPECSSPRSRQVSLFHEPRVFVPRALLRVTHFCTLILNYTPSPVHPSPNLLSNTYSLSIGSVIYLFVMLIVSP